jgi:hypothetical protein
MIIRMIINMSSWYFQKKIILLFWGLFLMTKKWPWGKVFDNMDPHKFNALVIDFSFCLSFLTYRTIHNAKGIQKNIVKNIKIKFYFIS